MKVRVVNVVDLMTLQPKSEHPHGLSDREFDTIFTTSRPVLFNFHGYPWLIHRLTYRRSNHANLHVRGVDMLDGTPILDIKPYLSSVPEEKLRRGWLAEAEARRK